MTGQGWENVLGTLRLRLLRGQCGMEQDRATLQPECSLSAQPGSGHEPP